MPVLTALDTRTLVSLFSGIGLFELGLLRAGFGPLIHQVEIDPFCRRVLARHWPDVPRSEDVRQFGKTNVASAFAICGGFPCQPVSVAGKRAAQDDPRWLWPEFRRVIDELEPSLVFVENVLGLRTAGLRGVLADLAALGFDAEWAALGAVGVGAPHARKRLWIVASHPNRVVIRDEPGWLGRACGEASAVTRQACEGLLAADADGIGRLESALRFARVGGWPGYCGWDFDPSARVDDGGTRGVVGARRKALGNGVNVRCAEVIGRATMEAMRCED